LEIAEPQTSSDWKSRETGQIRVVSGTQLRQRIDELGAASAVALRRLLREMHGEG
jgi:hypothetical protein